MSGFGCVYCNRVFPEERGLQAHIRFGHEGQAYGCERRAEEATLAQVLGGGTAIAAGGGAEAVPA